MPDREPAEQRVEEHHDQRRDPYPEPLGPNRKASQDEDQGQGGRAEGALQGRVPPAAGLLEAATRLNPSRQRIEREEEERAVGADGEREQGGSVRWRRAR